MRSLRDFPSVGAQRPLRYRYKLTRWIHVQGRFRRWNELPSERTKERLCQWSNGKRQASNEHALLHPYAILDQPKARTTRLNANYETTHAGDQTKASSWRRGERGLPFATPTKTRQYFNVSPRMQVRLAGGSSGQCKRGRLLLNRAGRLAVMRRKLQNDLLVTGGLGAQITWTPLTAGSDTMRTAFPALSVDPITSGCRPASSEPCMLRGRNAPCVQ